jgi:hypothetical protein
MKVLRITAPVVSVVSEQAADTIAFYEKLYRQQARARLTNPTGSLDLTLVGPILIIAGSPAAIASRRDLKATLIVDDLDDSRQFLLAHNCSLIEDVTEGPMAVGVPIGRFLFARHPDGSMVEYFEPNRT